MEQSTYEHAYWYMYTHLYRQPTEFTVDEPVATKYCSINCNNIQ